MRSLRQKIDLKCKSCSYDRLAAGTWRQQVTLCASTKCPLYDVRPVNTSKIPKNVLSYYKVSENESKKLHGLISRGVEYV